MNKKGAIELSLNTIIVVVLSVVVLMFLMSFLSDIWTSSTEKLTEQLNNEPSPPAASLSNPITLSKDSITAHPGNTEVVKIRLFNTDETQDLVDVTPVVSCKDMDVTYEFNEKLIPSRKSEEFQGHIIIPAGISPKPYLCSVGFNKAGFTTKDLTITVK